MVDWGDDASLSIALREIHTETEEKLKPGNLHRIRESVRKVSDAYSLYKTSLHDLRNSGVHPSTLASNGVSIGPFIKKHGYDALIDFGFSWADMRDMGLTAKQACAMNASQMRKIGVNASMLMEVRPSINDIASMRMSAAELCAFGFDSNLLISGGLCAQNMAQFGYSVADWKQKIGIHDWNALGFCDYSACERMGWSRADLFKYNVIQDDDASTTTEVAEVAVPSKSGPLQF